MLNCVLIKVRYTELQTENFTKTEVIILKINPECVFHTQILREHVINIITRAIKNANVRLLTY